jgi:hypothetical protein
MMTVIFTMSAHSFKCHHGIWQSRLSKDILRNHKQFDCRSGRHRMYRNVYLLLLFRRCVVSVTDKSRWINYKQIKILLFLRALSSGTWCRLWKSRSACRLLLRWYFARLILRYVPSKRQLTFNGPHGVIYQKIALFITTALGTSHFLANVCDHEWMTILHWQCFVMSAIICSRPVVQVMCL